MTASFTIGKDHFVASPIQFAGAGAMVVALILLAFVLPLNSPLASANVAISEDMALG